MNLFSYIKSQLPILAFAQEYTTLAKAGLYWKGRCPLHNEKTGSFTISPHKEIFYCFGCNAGGDIISLAAKMENCSPLEAANILVERYQLTLPDNLSSEKNSSSFQEEKKQYTSVCSVVAAWCHENIKKQPSLLQLLHERNLSQTSINEFQIGYFPGGLHAVKACLAFAKKHNLLAADLLDAQILFQGKTVLYSPFEERIIFPIKDHLGHHCGFGGRIFKPNDTRAKYYNSRENTYFNKGSLLFGLNQAKKAIQESHTVFLVEGYTDCIAMVQQGFTNTVATLGTACTLEHLKLIARYADKLYVIYDGDKAGKEAVVRLTKLCWQVDMEFYAVCLPSNEDPASFLHAKKDLQSLIDQATDIFAFFIQKTGNEFESLSLAKKLNLTRTIIDLIASQQDPLKQGILLQKASKCLLVPLAALQSALTQQRPQRVQPDENPPALLQPDPTSKTASELEKKIFFAIMHNIPLLDGNDGEYLLSHLPEPLSSLLKKLKPQKELGNSYTFDTFFNTLDEQEKLFVSRLTMEFEDQVLTQTFEQLVTQLKKKNWKLMVSQVKQQLEHAKKEEDFTAVEKIMADFLQLKKRFYATLSSAK